jgi:hypothetical protein
MLSWLIGISNRIHNLYLNKCLAFDFLVKQSKMLFTNINRSQIILICMLTPKKQDKIVSQM